MWMHGLSKNGNKDKLVRKLKEKIQKNLVLLVDTLADQEGCNAGDKFGASAY